MNAKASPPQTLDMLIVGAGISGIGMAAHLAKRLPGKRFLIVERRAQPGGTWDLFRYPGVRSDSDMFTLGYSFAPWREDRSIVGGADIRGYLEEVIDSQGLRPHIRFNQAVTAADWDGTAGVWRVCTASGDRFATRFLFLGSGYYDYDDPHDPLIPGLESFAGETVHPQFWPQDLDLSGKRVVVIGSGATAASLVPAIAETAEHVTMLQRTPSWFLARPVNDHAAAWLRRLLPESLAYSLARQKNIWMQRYLFRSSRDSPEAMKTYLGKQLQEALGADYEALHFTPPYDPWEQRMCLIPEGDLFAAIRGGKASIVTGRIERADAAGIGLEDGRHVPSDVVVTATGLRIALLGKIELSIDGVPVNIADHFYYRSCLFSNLPNLAALFGYLNASWTLRVDLIADWICRLLVQMDAWRADIVTPHLPDAHGLIEVTPSTAFPRATFDAPGISCRRAAPPSPGRSAPTTWRIGAPCATPPSTTAYSALKGLALQQRRPNSERCPNRQQVPAASTPLLSSSSAMKFCPGGRRTRTSRR